MWEHLTTSSEERKKGITVVDLAYYLDYLGREEDKAVIGERQQAQEVKNRFIPPRESLVM